MLETRGVPVVGWQSDEVAGFLSRSSGHRAPLRVESAEEVAALVARQRALGLSGAILVTVPLPEGLALPQADVAAAVERATRDALRGRRPWAREHARGSCRAWPSSPTVARSRANLALIENDAAVAARIAVALAARS